MTLNYNKLGFRCGLEIHQQLEGEKLFCNCQTLNTDKEGNVSASRKLRAVVGETGEIDPAAAHEMAKGKTFQYTSHTDDTCLVEYDEEPPQPVNGQALEAAVKVALLLNATIVDEIHFMRKTVVDGSNVSGFQRTGLIAVGGFVETEEGKVEISSICLEEEAAQKIKDEDQERHYKLDRLGIPLIEIATSASILNPEHAKKVAAHIGMVLRSVEGVKRGLGTIRQDVNVSIEKGARTEIKGFQDLKSIPKVITYEVERQISSIEKGGKIVKEVRKAESDFTTSFLRPMPGVARMYPETDVLPVQMRREYIIQLKENLPSLLGDRIQKYINSYKIREDMAKELLSKEKLNGFFQECVGLYPKIEPAEIAHILVTIPKDLKSRLQVDISKLTNADFDEVLSYLNEEKITKEAVPEILTKKAKGEKVELAEFKGISEEELEKEIKKIVKEKPGLNVGGYMGLVMIKFRGKVEGKKVMEFLKKHVK